MYAELHANKLGQIVDYCKYDLYSSCKTGDCEPDTCAKCVAEAANDIVRTQL